MSSGDRTHDLVLYGATGFVGRLTAAYLAGAAPEGARIALGGRSRERREAVRATLPAAARDWPLVVVDSTDDEAVGAMAASTTAVATTVGPYAKFGLPLVQACARTGTHYADLTGEVLFVRDSIDTAHDAAVASGARIVHACGFDSIPSDLSVLLAAEQAAADGEGELTETLLCLVSSRGGVSGGTIDSLRTQVDVVKADAVKRRLTADPYTLSPDRAAEPDHGKESDLFLTRREPLLGGRWVAPFVMAPFNTRIVRRSNAVAGYRYGHGFRYSEVMGVGGSPAAPLLASAVALGAGGVAAGLAVAPTRWLLDKVLPAPGEGPSQATRDSGHFHVETTTVTTTGARYRSTVRAQGDPGYAATAVMLGESALALALDPLPEAAGVLTPATGIGARLADRLRDAGFTLTVERLPVERLA
ncbi:MAG: putative saccharopine dehydrogenase/reductase [Frankiales bacterium]|nr:putative saccharopine dehydrogenase/reductase [Frankiales bacterium]